MKLRYLFLIVLLIAVGVLLFFVTSPQMVVLVLVLDDPTSLEINNGVYNGITLFKEKHNSDIQIIIKEVKNEKDAQALIEKIKPDFVISALHKPVFEKIVSSYNEKYERFINIFPFYESAMVKNLNPSFNDLSYEVVKFLKGKSINSVNICHDNAHLTRLLLNYLKKSVENSEIKIDENSDFHLMVFNDVLCSAHEISHVTALGKEVKAIIVSTYPFRFYEIYGKHLDEFYAVFPKYVFTKKGRDFVENYKKIFKCYPEWPAVLVYDALSMIDKYGKETIKIVKYSGIAGEYNFSESDNLFTITKFKSVKVR